jgi:hypothetical protein
MQCKAFHPGFVVTGLVGLLILMLNLCTNQPAFAQTANPQFKIQELNLLNANSLMEKRSHYEHSNEEVSYLCGRD